MAPTVSHYFDAQIIHQLSTALSWLNELQKLFLEFQHLPDVENDQNVTARDAAIANQRKAYLDNEIPIFATLTYNHLVHAVDALIKEGGKIPEALGLPTAHKTGRPLLLPDPFSPRQ